MKELVLQSDKKTIKLFTMKAELEKDKKALLLDLYRVAWIDGEITNEEQLIINKICFENGISFDELASILKGKKEENTLPTEENDKRKHLFEVARLIIADGKIREEEIFLFDRILSALRFDNKAKDVLKKEIFKIVIDEYFRNEEKRLNDLKEQLSYEYEKNINVETERLYPESDIKKMINDLKSGYEKGIYGIGHVKKPRIFLLGQFNQDENYIIDLITSVFRKYNIELDDKTVKTCTGDYKKVKKTFSNYNQALQNGSFDYFLYGPHPHHLNGKNNEQTWEEYLKSTSTLVKGDYDKPLSKEQIKKFSQQFAKHWISNN
jgi:tellurite resistance protein